MTKCLSFLPSFRLPVLPVFLPTFLPSFLLSLAALYSLLASSPRSNFRPPFLPSSFSIPHFPLGDRSTLYCMLPPPSLILSLSFLPSCLPACLFASFLPSFLPPSHNIQVVGQNDYLKKMVLFSLPGFHFRPPPSPSSPSKTAPRTVVFFSQVELCGFQ